MFSHFFKQYKHRTVIACLAISVASIITAITLIALPALLGLLVGRDNAKSKLFNEFFSSIGIHPSPENLIGYLIVGIIIQNIILAAARIYSGFTAAKLIKDLRKRILSAISEAEWSYYIKRSSGKLANTVIHATNTAGQGYMNAIEIIATSVQVLAYLAVAFLLSWQIAVVAIVSSSIFMMLSRKLVLSTKDLGREDMKLAQDVSGVIVDSLRNIKSLKAMARESHSHSLLDSFNKKLKSSKKKTTINEELLTMSQELFLMCLIVLTIYIAIKHIQLPIEFGIVLVIIYIRTLKLFGKIQSLLQKYANCFGAYENVIKTIQAAEKNHEKRPGNIKQPLNGDIKISNLVFEYKNKLVLDEVSATIHFNQLNTIVGESGAGKTTLVDLICGLYLPKSGDILINNVSLKEMDVLYWRSQIGYVVQDNNLLSSTIRENITLGDTKYSDDEVYSALEKAHALTFVEQLSDKLDTTVGQGGAMLSGGQKQRILIARALVHSPKLLILDEATSALDETTERSISSIFKELSRSITIISISHRPAMLEISDNVITLKDGKLIEA